MSLISSKNGKREYALIAGFATLCVADAAYRLRQLLVQATAQPFAPVSYRNVALHSAIDLVAWIAGVFICVTVARLAWTLRRRISFAMTGYLLFLLLIAFGFLVVLDFLRTRNPGLPNNHRDNLSLAVEVIIIIVALLLVPFLRRVVEFGFTAEQEHSRFLAAASANNNAFFLLEPIASLGKQRDFRISFANAKAEALLLAPRGKSIHRRLGKLFPALQSNGALKKLLEVEATGTPLIEELSFTDSAGRKNPFSLQAFKRDIGIAAVFADTSERKRLADSVTHLALHDALTGLPNRTLLLQRIDEAMQRASHTGTQLAVLAIALNKFKRINDSLGHAAGDELLRTISQRLIAASRPQDAIARINGDEFVILLEALDTNAYALHHASTILAVIEADIEVLTQTLNISASIGICVASAKDAEVDAATILRCANIAMFEVKKQGIGGVLEYTDDIHVATNRILQLEQELRHATERGQMQLYYQPQVNTKTHIITGVEALLRWNHPEHGMISPAEFIAIAEETGMIVQIGAWALREGCLQMATLQKRTGRRFSLAVNLSGKQFIQEDLVATVEDALQNSGFAPADLELELTESTLMNDSAQTQTQLKSVLELGCRLAIDDFGTGFSSFQYILDYNVDCLKIDRSFISKCPTDAKATAIVQTIIAMAHELKIPVVAEGVETEEQLHFLLSRDCEICQGYLFAKPMTLTQLEERLAHDAALTCAAAS